LQPFATIDDLTEDDDHADVALGSDFRKFARSQLITLQEDEGEESPSGMMGMDGMLIAKIKGAINAFTGIDGKIGEQGIQGERGPIGEQGPGGVQGENGPKGPFGPKSKVTGPPGVKGNEGPTGKTGVQGKKGNTGPQGTPGRQGGPGGEGPVGTKNGPQGKQGDTGDVGPGGKIGPRGLTGDRGKKGEDGIQGGEGSSGLAGLTGVSGKRGMVGPRGQSGPQGVQGQEGVTGDTGLKGDTGPDGPKGVLGLDGMSGLMGPQGKPGDKGKQGMTGAVGLHGLKGLLGDRGTFGLPGVVGTAGSIGDQGYPGLIGYDGEKGQKGNEGEQGVHGSVGEHGKRGVAGKGGPKGPKGPNFAYSITGPTKFSAGIGGDKGLMFSGIKGLVLEHNTNPCQIRFVQKIKQQGKSALPAIIAGLGGRLGIGVVTPEKDLHIMDQCISENDDQCANRKGPLLLSASWRNTVMSKVGNSYYDMIGAYTNWAKDTSSVHIGARDQMARPAVKISPRVVFGGNVKQTDGLARFEPSVGKFYATKFAQNVAAAPKARILEDADSFLDVAHTAKTVDVAHTHVALHAKTARHAQKLAGLEEGAAGLLRQVRALQAAKLVAAQSRE